MAPGLRIPTALFFALFFTVSPQVWCEPMDGNAALREVNVRRKIEGLPPLLPEPAAAAAGTIYAGQLAARRVLSHYGKDGSRVMERYRGAGGTGTAAAENLGAGRTIKAIVESWLKSPAHKENMLSGRWTRGGAGIHSMENGRMVLVFVFSNSRWETKSLLKNKEKQTIALRGRFFTEPGAGLDGLVRLRINKNIYGASESAQQGGGENNFRTLFLFPSPEEWERGLLAPAFLETKTAAGWMVSDLLLLDTPDSP